MMNTPIFEKKKLTNGDILRLHASLSRLKNAPGFKLNYAISRTLKSLAGFPKAYSADRLISKSAEYLNYERDLFAAYQAISAKTVVESGPGGEYERLDLDINSEEAKAARAEVQTKYKNALTERQQQEDEYAAWLDEECSDKYEIFKVQVADMPAGDGDHKAVWDACALLIDFDETV